MKLLPPNWAPKAIATNQGWVDPKTNELLVSYRGLKTLIDNQKPKIIKKDEPVIDESNVEKKQRKPRKRKSIPNE